MAAPPAWVLGALICLFGSTLTALGLVLQKHSHNTNAGGLSAAGGGRQAVKYWLQTWWLLGFLTFLAAQIINMVAMAMTPQVVLSCLGSWTLACNTLFARCILKETLSALQTLAVAGLVVSSALVISSAPRPCGGPGPSANALARRFLSPEFEALTAILLAVVCFARILASVVLRTPAQPAIVVLQATAPAGKIEGPRTLAPEGRHLSAPLSWAAMAAVGAGYTALLFKCVAEIVAGPLVHPEAALPWWCSWETYAITVVALVCAPAELHCLNLALQCGEAALVVPAYLTLGMLAQLTTGAVFFGELRSFQSASHAVCFGVSVLLTLVFVVLMAKAQDSEAGDCGQKAAAPDLCVKLAPADLEEEEQAQRGAHQKLDRQLCVAGFGGAIECLEARRGRRDWQRLATWC